MAQSDREDMRRSGKQLEPNPKKYHKPEPAPKPEVRQPKLSKKVPTKEKRTYALRPASQFLDLGAGYQIAHKPGSGYSILYRIVAERGHFGEVVRMLENNNVNVKDPIQAARLLDMMMVPVDKLAEFCRNDPDWLDHSNKKTAALREKVKEGDPKAKEVLENASRCEDGVWQGNLSEMLSTCVGYYNYLVELWRLGGSGSFGGKGDEPNVASKPNKNVKKFQEANVVFRRYPLNKGGNERAYVMMYPEKFIKQIKTAILTVKNVDEDKFDE